MLSSVKRRSGSVVSTLCAREVFDGLTITLPDQRQDYGEPRFITAGWLDERLLVLVWTPRGLARRIISMRKANEREIDKYKQSLG